MLQKFVLLTFFTAYYFTKAHSKEGRLCILKDYIEDRATEIGKYIIREKATVRDTAKIFGVSKSTVHKDVTERLQKINPTFAQEVKEVLDQNKSERHIRGGNATKLKFKPGSEEEE
jgi:putative DeoR family transcriptional regulator, stage III sporulation protein D